MDPTIVPANRHIPGMIMPKLSFRPLETLKGFDFSTYNITSLVSATSPTGEYPELGDAVEERQTERQIRNTIIIATIVLGDALPILPALLNKSEVNDGDRSVDYWKAECSKYKSNFCGPSDGQGRIFYVREKIGVHELDVDLYVLARLAQAATQAGKLEAAAQYAADVEEAQRRMRLVCDDMLADIGNLSHGKQTKRSYTWLPDKVTATWSARERARILVLQGKYNKSVEEIVEAGTNRPQPELHWGAKKREDRISLFAERDDFKDWVMQWLGWASSAFDVKANLRHPPMFYYLREYWMGMCELLGSMVGQFHNDRDFMLESEANPFLRNRIPSKILRRSSDKYIKMVASLPAHYKDLCERPDYVAEWGPRKMTGLNAVLVRPGSRRAGIMKAATVAPRNIEWHDEAMLSDSE